MEIAKEQLLKEGKPADRIEKILEGKKKKLFDDIDYQIWQKTEMK